MKLCAIRETDLTHLQSRLKL